MKSVVTMAMLFLSQALWAQTPDVVVGLNEMKSVSLVSRRCVRALTDYLDEKVILKTEQTSLLKGFGAGWDESLYMQGETTASLLFSNTQAIYFYNEGSDVSGEVYRCNRETGEITQPLKNYSHYPSCEDINNAIASESAAAATLYDYCAEHPQD